MLLLLSACGTATDLQTPNAQSDVGVDAADAAVVDVPAVDSGRADAMPDVHTPDAAPRDTSEPDVTAIACFVCGDDVCSDGEGCATCARDCGECPCGDGTCDLRESCTTCPSDCGGDCPCGDGVCNSDRGETCAECVADCGCDCDDARCDPGEWVVCPAPDVCGFVDFCGDSICDEREFENSLNCPIDCRCR